MTAAFKSALSGVITSLKYANRLSMLDFVELLFPDSIESYWMPKWELFRDNPLHFYWSLDNERLMRLADYILQQQGAVE